MQEGSTPQPIPYQEHPSNTHKPASPHDNTLPLPPAPPSPPQTHNTRPRLLTCVLSTRQPTKQHDTRVHPPNPLPSPSPLALPPPPWPSPPPPPPPLTCAQLHWRRPHQAPWPAACAATSKLLGWVHQRPALRQARHPAAVCTYMKGWHGRKGVVWGRRGRGVSSSPFTAGEGAGRQGTPAGRRQDACRPSRQERQQQTTRGPPGGEAGSNDG
jgi:hypothetical protein